MTEYNPSVQQIPRQQPAAVIPERGDSSILRWLESTGRLIHREVVEATPEEADNEEISDLMGEGEDGFDDDSDDDDDDD